MANVTMSGNVVLIDGVSTETLAGSMKAAGLADKAIAEYLGWIFVGATGGSAPAPFHFSVTVPADVAACAPTYTRAFAHEDWVDGSSRVQAGMTPEELGFNARFHAIELDFDAVAAEFRKLGACLAELRRQMATVVSELEAKITSLQSEIHEIKKALSPSTGTGLPRPAIFEGVPDFSLLGRTRKDGKDWLIIREHGDIRLVEEVLGGPGPASGPVPGVFPTDPADLLDLFSEFANLVRVDPEIAHALEDELTIAEIDERFGHKLIGAGAYGPHTLRQALAGAPRDMVFSDVFSLVKGVVESTIAGMTASRLKTTRETVLKVAAQEKVGASLLNSGVNALVGVDDRLAEGFKGAGFGSIAKLAKAEPAAVETSLREAGITDVQSTTIGRAVIAARLASAVKNVR